MNGVMTKDWKLPLFLLALAIFVGLSLQTALPAYADGGAVPSGADANHQLILVKFAPNTSEAERTQIIAQMGGGLVRWIPQLSTAEVRAPISQARSGLNPLDMARQNAQVVSVEADEVISGLPIVETQLNGTLGAGNSTVPAAPVPMNDPDFNDPQKVYAPQLIEAPMAWNYTLGSKDVKIAVVDTGVNYNHPDLAGRVLPGYDFVNNDADPMDDHGHGTHIAGIIAAVGNNGIGSVGICPECSILPVKVLDANNTGTWGTVAQGIVYAVDSGADIINLSLGGQSVSQVVRDAVEYAVQHDVLVVAAAGNGRSDAPFYPAALDNVIGVSATRDDDTRWSLSNYGNYIDLAAPGYAIYSTYADLNNYYGGYTFMSGTSMAAPHVAAVAGLLLSQNPDRTAADLWRLLRTTAVDLGDAGWDAYFGYGRVDALAALQAEAPAPQANAKMSGIVWLDENTNGVRDQNERAVTGKITVQITDSQGATAATASPDGQGVWQVSDLPAGNYRVTVQLSNDLRLTTASFYDVELAPGQDYTGLDFGVASNEPVAYAYQTFVPIVAGD